MKARVHITLKSGVLDPQGKAVEQSLSHMGFAGLGEIRMGRYLEIDLPGYTDSAQAEADVRRMCERLLANPVMERFTIEVEG